jgi:hypothetical protein
MKLPWLHHLHATTHLNAQSIGHPLSFTLRASANRSSDSPNSTERATAQKLQLCMAVFFRDHPQIMDLQQPRSVERNTAVTSDVLSGATDSSQASD